MGRLAGWLVLLFLLSAMGCGGSPNLRLQVAHSQPLASLLIHDPGHNRASYNILCNVYEPLLRRGPDLRLKPVLAESWYSPDPRTWVFKLRSGVRRHDGRILTARDVVASIEESMRDPWSAGALATVSVVRARGEREVVFTTRESDNTLPARLVYILVSGQPAPQGATGPYRILPPRPDGSILLQAFREHRSGAPAIAEAEFQVVGDPAERARMLMRGETHVVEEVRPADMAALRVAPGVTTVEFPGFTTAFLAMDTARERTPYVDQAANPFRDPRVREALDRALDRGALVAGPLFASGEPTAQFPVPGQIGFDPTLEPTKPDVARARRLLEEAGYGSGFEVQLDYSGRAAGEVVRVLAEQLASIGVRVRGREGKPAEFLPRVERRDTSFYLLRWIQPSQEISETYTWLLHTPEAGFGTMNGGGYANATLDRLLAESARRRLSNREHAPQLREATALIHGNRPVLPLYRENDLYAFSDRLDYRPEPFEQFSTVLERMKWRR
jgi:peptide/nickel transport system substrate-binding protein